MPFPFNLPRTASPRLRGLQFCQLGVVFATIVAAFFAAVIPSKHKAFTFSLLYSLIATSVTTTILVRKEQAAATEGTLTKDKYVKYQLFKILAAGLLYVVGFIAFLATPVGETSGTKTGNGLWINGVRVNKYQAFIIWMNVFNWLFMWASLFYSCCMSQAKEGAVRLAGGEARIGLDAEYGDETSNDEAIARELQGQDPNWRV